MCAVFDSLPHGVMVAPQILNLLVKVRVLMRQPFDNRFDAVLFLPTNTCRHGGRPTRKSHWHQAFGGHERLATLPNASDIP